MWRFALLLLLAGCSNAPTQSNSLPLNPTPPPVSPLTLAMPKRRVFKADFTQASIGLSGFLEQETPPPWIGGDPNAIWCTFPRPGMQGMWCIDPAPNKGYYTEHGDLVLTPGPISAASPGFPVLTKQTFSRDYPLAVSCTISFSDVGSQAAYAGPAIYNGEANYRAIYGQNDTGADIDLIVDATATGATMPNKIATNAYHAMDLLYAPGGAWRYFFNGQEFFPQGITDDPELKNDPHVGLFVGGFNAVRISRFEVYSDDPALPTV